MRAVVIDYPGGVEQLQVRTVPAPRPADDEVRVRVAYAGCNWSDTQIRQGIYPHAVSYPLVPGVEISGVVDSVGARVADVAPGQRVCAILPRGGYAEYATVHRDDVVVVPDPVPLKTAAAFLIQGLSAYHLLHTVHRLEPGEVVLCHAIGGGVGSYVTQLGVAGGATVIGTVGSPGKSDLPYRLGAERVIDTREEDFVEVVLDVTGAEGADLAIDSLGGFTLDRTFEAMRLLGHVINIGEAEGGPLPNVRDRLLPRSLTFTRFHLRHVGMRSRLWGRGVEYLTCAVAQGRVAVPVFATFPLEQVADMHTTLEKRSVAGKVLLRIDDN